MKKIFLVLAFLLVFGFGGRISEAGDHPNVASLDSETFIITNGASIYLMKVEDGKVIIKDAVFVFTRSANSVNRSNVDGVVMERQRIEIK